MFGMFKMSEEQKAMLATKNLISFRNLNDIQIRKYSCTPITTMKISFTTQKIVMILDGMYKVASYSGNFKYKDISTNNTLYKIVGDYFITILQDETFFPSYEEFQEYSNLIISELFTKLIGPDNTFRNEIHT